MTKIIFLFQVVNLQFFALFVLEFKISYLKYHTTIERNKTTSSCSIYFNHDNINITSWENCIIIDAGAYKSK